MEKLQIALKKARDARQAALQSAPVQTPPPREISATAVGNWEALPEVSLDPHALSNNRIITHRAQPEASAFDILRTKMLIQMHKNGWKRVAITSPNKSCGKSTLAANLAIGFSRQKDVRTLLLDLDLHRPSLARILDCRPERDFSEMLTGDVAPSEQLMRLSRNLAVSLQNTAVVDPSALLASDNITELLQRLEDTYQPDLVIADLSPMLMTDTTRALLRHMDCALIVVRADHSRLQQLDVCERDVAEYTNVLGIALNSCQYTDKSSVSDDYY